MAQKIRYAVIGLGHIAQTAVLPAFKHARKNSELVALVSGDSKKLKKIAAQFKVPNVFSYDDYDGLLDAGLIDAVYICLPNHMHHQYARPALKKRIHVLCEKPLAINKDDCLDLIQTAEASNTKFMTAYRLHFEPANLKAIELIQKRKIGDVRYFNSSFSFKIKDRNNIRLKNETGGGPLWDIGIYCINAARYLFQTEPLEVMALSAAGEEPQFQEVDETVGVSMKFPGEKIANFVCSFGASGTADFQIFGTKGSIHLENAYEYAMPRKLTLKTERGQKTFRFAKGDQFAPELIYFSDCILKNKEVEPSGYEGLADVQIIQALYESASTGKAIRLQTQEALQEKKRPSARQKFREPPVREVSTVGVRSPS